ncbi:spermidine synthase [Alkalicoccus chagannorensis]|uniref:spermidine synthase n=1 Tax=Alkalicoccus chagannorensis TaxID=427072 RepID=UPI00041E68F9|nr:hypothetical protein [Alkalicoccus chagannorensis]
MLRDIEPLDIVEKVHTSRGELQLQRRGSDYEVISSGTFLMATYNGTSERRMVTRSLQESRGRTILIGGLGTGFSLAEALRHPRVQEAVVVEIEEAVIRWNETHLAGGNGYAVHHPKTRMIHADIVPWLHDSQETFDAICLDIDNGPDWTVTAENADLYERGSLQQLRRRLNPGGVVSFWSAGASPAFVSRLQRVFPQVEVEEVPVPKGEPDVIFYAWKEARP